MSDLANNPTVTTSINLRKQEPSTQPETSTTAPLDRLDDLARMIKVGHQEITKAKKNIIERAM
jgi:hypothetical protein